MKTLLTLLVAAGLAVAAFAQQAAAPQPGPDQWKMAVWYGDWTYTGEIHATSFGPAGKFTGRMTGAPIQNGFAGEFIYDEQGPGGEVRYLEIDFWDPIVRDHAYIFVGNDGYAERGTFTMKGDLTTFENTILLGDQPRRIRGTETVAADRSWFTRKIEVLVDGKNWVPYADTKFTRETGTAPAGKTWTQEQQAVADCFRRWAAAEVAGDTARIMAGFAADGTVWDFNAAAPLDRAGYQAMLTEFLQRMKVSSCDLNPESVQVAGDLAIAHGHYRENYTDAKGMALTSGGPWTGTLSRSGGKWLVQDISYLEQGGPAEAALIEQELMKLEHAWARAYVDRDVAVLERIEAGNWVCTPPDGEVFGKAEDIGDVKSGAYQATAFVMSDLKVRLHGDTAVVFGRQSEKATYKGADASKELLFTDTWVKAGGRWQCVATHLSPAPKK